MKTKRLSLLSSMTVLTAACLGGTALAASQYHAPVIKGPPTVAFDKSTGRFTITFGGLFLDKVEIPEFQALCGSMPLRGIEAMQPDGSKHLSFTMPSPRESSSCVFTLIDHSDAAAGEADNGKDTHVTYTIDKSKYDGATEASAADPTPNASADAQAGQSTGVSKPGQPDAIANIIYASVTRKTSYGAEFATNLKSDEFELFLTNSKGERRKVRKDGEFTSQHHPLTVGILVDASGSMTLTAGSGATTKRKIAVAAAARVAEVVGEIGTPKARSNGFVINFNQTFYFNGNMKNPEVNVDNAGTFLTEKAQDLKSWIDLADESGLEDHIKLGGATAMREAILQAVNVIKLTRQHDNDEKNISPKFTARQQELIAQAFADAKAKGLTEAQAIERGLPAAATAELDELKEATGQARQRAALFVISDGFDNDSRKFASLEAVAAEAAREGILIFGINFEDAKKEDGSNPTGGNQLVQLAHVTGGDAISIAPNLSTFEAETTIRSFTERVTGILTQLYSFGLQNGVNDCESLEVVAHDLSPNIAIFNRLNKDQWTKEKSAYDKAAFDSVEEKVAVIKAQAQELEDQRQARLKAAWDKYKPELEQWYKDHPEAKEEPRPSSFQTFGSMVSQSGFVCCKETGVTVCEHRDTVPPGCIPVSGMSPNSITMGSSSMGPKAPMSPLAPTPPPAPYEPPTCVKTDTGSFCGSVDDIVSSMEERLIRQITPFDSLASWASKHPGYNQYLEAEKAKRGAQAEAWIDSFPSLDVMYRKLVGVCDLNAFSEALKSSTGGLPGKKLSKDDPKTFR